jgi:uncharacterized protein
LRKPFSLLIKPASADCNLHCDYCFYLDHKELYPETKRHRMSDEVLNAMIRSYMRTEQPTYSFGWQGGEPTLMGQEFFERVTDLQKEHGRRGAVVANGLQTNATLITEELASHLAKYRFLLGVSLDGPQSIHDLYRTSVDGRGSYDSVLEGIGHLRRHKVEYNILVLVSSANVTQSAEIYRYLVDKGEYFHQYIPCVEFDEKGEPLPYTISGKQWGEFLHGIFKEWKKNDIQRVSIRHFDAILNLLVHGRPNVCFMERNCCQYFVVEYNGDVYPCDFFVQRDLKLGNVLENSWDELLSSDLYREFGARKSSWNAECKNCSFLKLCFGDCQKHRNGIPDRLSHLCEGWKVFYERTLSEFQDIAQWIVSRNSQQAAAPPQRAPGRNDPCYCGSGKKYKHCHGR